MLLLVICIVMAVAFFAGLGTGIVVTESYWRDALNARRLQTARKHCRPL